MKKEGGVEKKAIALLLGLAMSVLSLAAFCSCVKTGGASDENGENETSGFSLQDGKACLRWERVSGCDGYRVYKSPSRYGEYVAASEDLKETYYEDADAYAYYRVVGVKKGGEIVRTIGQYSFDAETFGENVCVYADTDSEKKIQQDFDNAYKISETGEFSDMRFAALFKKGDYPSLDLKIGYYTTVSGLGADPADVSLAKMNVVAANSLCNFWRSAENLTIKGNMTWAVSQATSLRRINVEGDLSLSNGGYVSGGFLADSKISGSVYAGSQQQWLSRNCQWKEWQGGVFNMVFVGVPSPIPAAAWPQGRFTGIEKTESIAEKPFLTFDEKDGYGVVVPPLKKDASGVSYAADVSRKLPLSDFYVARSDRDTSETINAALAKGKHLLLTPGIYALDSPLRVTKADSVILGLGLATLKISDKNTDCLMRVSDADGIRICGILFDAGAYSQKLLEVGAKDSSRSSASPICLSDLYFRVGGVANTKTSVDVCVELNADGVIGDNFWVWRADHTDGVGWDVNPAPNGLIVNGDNVTFYGLFVEHFLEYQTIWNGENGCTYFYQSELPYDVPYQSRWMSHGDTVNGYSSYKVGDGVSRHRAYGVGVYSYLRDNAVRLENAVETPGASGIKFTHIVTVWLGGNKDSGIDHIVDGTGGGVSSASGNGSATIDLYAPGNTEKNKKLFK